MSPFRSLKSTGCGKHMGPFSYYHYSVIERVPAAASALRSICQRLQHPEICHYVVKLDAAYRVSFLSYQSFTVPFPALLAAVSCDLSRNSARHTDYSNRHNPPILHRKELLLPHDHPLSAVSTRLTTRLEQLGAFRDTRRIGTGSAGTSASPTWASTPRTSQPSDGLQRHNRPAPYGAATLGPLVARPAPARPRVPGRPLLGVRLRLRPRRRSAASRRNGHSVRRLRPCVPPQRAAPPTSSTSASSSMSSTTSKSVARRFAPRGPSPARRWSSA